MRIDPERAWNMIAALGEQLQLSALDTAFAVHVIANARMSRPIRAVTVERGLDVRDFTLLAFGGSGPLHAAQLARDLGIRRLLIPPYAGVFSALGLSQAHAGHHLVQTYHRRLDELRPDELRTFINDLEQTMRARLAELNYPAGALRVLVAADLRYVGQAFNLTIDLTPDDSLNAIAERFGEQHERAYGHRADADPIEFVNLRLRAIVNAGHEAWQVTAAPRDVATAHRSRPMLFDRTTGLIETPLISRAELYATQTGPLAIEEPDTTIIVPPGCRVRLDAWGNIEIEVGAEDAHD
jgi:N-methylhydantoinase A